MTGSPPAQHINGLPVATSGGDPGASTQGGAPGALGPLQGQGVPMAGVLGVTPSTERWGLAQGPGWSLLRLGIAAGLLYAGYRRGVTVEEQHLNKRLILPFLGWSLLGPMGPDYLMGRVLTSSGRKKA